MMPDFKSKRMAFRVAPRALIAAGGMLVLALSWKFAVSDRTPRPPLLDPAAVSSLQHAAFTEAEAQPGFGRPETVTLMDDTSETHERQGMHSGAATAASHHPAPTRAKLLHSD